MEYDLAIKQLFSLPMFQNIGSSAYIPTLNNIKRLTTLLGDDILSYPMIHVAGTNGKGSTSHMIASVLQESGYRVGLFTSPHLLDYRERVRVNGAMISKDIVCRFMDRVGEYFNSNPVSFFEATTALAFYAFKQESVDIAIIEVGLGGEYDSTNIITPILSIITNISFDHKNILGNTIKEIAIQKGGIIKSGVPVVIGEHQEESDDVFISIAQSRDSRMLFAEDSFEVKGDKDGFVAMKSDKEYRFNGELSGLYQQKNIATVLMAINELSHKYIINDEDICRGIERCATNTNLKGRWQIVSTKPLVVCDTGHNEAGVRFIVKQLSGLTYRKLYMVLGFMADKELDEILPLLPKEAEYIFCNAMGDRAMLSAKLKEKADSYGLSGVAIEGESNVKEAVLSALRQAQEEDVIFVGGSTFVVADYLL